MLSSVINLFVSREVPAVVKEASDYRDNLKDFISEARKITDADSQISNQIRDRMTELKAYQERLCRLPQKEYQAVSGILRELDEFAEDLNDELLNQSFYRSADRVATFVQIGKELIPSFVRSLTSNATEALADHFPKSAACARVVPKTLGAVAYRVAKVGHKLTEQIGGAARKFAAKEYPSAKGVLRFAADTAIVYSIANGLSDLYDPYNYVLLTVAAVARNHLGMSQAWQEPEILPSQVQKKEYTEADWEKEVEDERKALVAPPSSHEKSVAPAGSNPFDGPSEDDWDQESKEELQNAPIAPPPSKEKPVVPVGANPFDGPSEDDW